MDPLTGGLISGATSGLLGIAGTIMGNNQSESNALQQENYQTQMSDTSYQRGVADMRAAGINPMLAATQGGASSPSGAMGAINNPGQAMTSAVSTGADTAMAIRAQNQQQDMNEANISNIHAQNSTEVSKQFLTSNQSAAAAQDVRMKANQNRLMEQTMDAQIKKAKAEGDYAQVNQIMGVLGTGASSAKSLLGLGLQF